MPAELDNSKPDRRIAAIARHRHGVITRDALLNAGLTSDAISRRVAAGRLHRLHRGVYAVGHTALSDEGRWLAAVLACGEGAVLSHRSASELWRMLRPRAGAVHVTVPGSGGRAERSGVIVHRSSVLLPSDTTGRSNVPVTTPARTIRDLRRTADEETVRRALREAQALGLPLGDAVNPGAPSPAPSSRTSSSPSAAATASRPPGAT